MFTRAPLEVAEEVRRRAEESGLCLSDFIARVLAHEVGLFDQAPQLPEKSQELPLTG